MPKGTSSWYVMPMTSSPGLNTRPMPSGFKRICGIGWRSLRCVRGELPPSMKTESSPAWAKIDGGVISRRLHEVRVCDLPRRSNTARVVLKLLLKFRCQGSLRAGQEINEQFGGWVFGEMV